MINNVRERNPMPEQAREVRCTNFNEVALGYTEADAIREAMRCLNCRKKPCVAGCPIHQQIPEFIARVAEGDFEGAYDIITVRSTMPSICGRVCPQEQQCEKNCAHAVKGEAVGIGRLERFVADWYAARHPVSAPQVEKKGKKVAVIGSGPAGIACAGDLAGYEAIFVGNGADVPQPPRGLDTSLTGVWSANDYLTQVNLHNDTLPANIKDAKRVLVVGGGNVAVDAVRCARRLGAETIMVYRRTIAEAPARRDEIAHTYEEDIEIRELTNPVSCYSKDGVLTGVKCEKMVLGEPDESGRRRRVGT